MLSFIESFYQQVDEHLGDPATSKRYPKDRRLRDLHAADKRIWERLSSASGPDGTLGRVETEIAIVADQAFYRLPGNFRRFVHLEQRQDEDRNCILSRLCSLPPYHPGPGVEILNAERGFIIRPTPTVDSDPSWTLIYERGPVQLHYAKAAAVGADFLIGGTPGENAGELIRLDDHYNGCLLRVYRATTGTDQTQEITDYDATSNTFKFRHAWTTIPTGEVWYEIRPTLPPDYDELYALAVAIRQCSGRLQTERKAGLEDDYKEAWAACVSYFGKNVMDRAPTLLKPYQFDEIDPWGD